MELEKRFSTEKACQDYLFQLRWPSGFRCSQCGGDKAWSRSDGLLECGKCGFKVSARAGTVFEGSRKPLVLWFRAIWWMTCQKNGASAVGWQRILGLGSYQTAWMWLHKLRRAMVRPGQDRLTGSVQVDKTFIGGAKPGNLQISRTAILSFVTKGRRNGTNNICWNYFGSQRAKMKETQGVGVTAVNWIPLLKKYQHG